MLLPLEPRLVFDGAVDATLAEVDAQVQDALHDPQAGLDSADHSAAENAAPVPDPVDNEAAGQVDAVAPAGTEEHASSDPEHTIAAATQSDGADGSDGSGPTEAGADDGGAAESHISDALAESHDQESGQDETSAHDAGQDDVSAQDGGDGTGAAEITLSDTGAESRETTLVVIDAGVTNYEQLVQGIDPDAEVLVIQDGEAGVAAISQALDAMGQVDSLHLITHGEPGAVKLGSDILSLESLQGQFQDQVSDWADNFTENGDIFVYGCSAGAGETGAGFVEALADATGADVAASDDPTGAESRGGDWTFEVTAGTLAARGVIGAETLAAYQSVLSAPDPTISNPTTQAITITEDSAVTFSDGNGNRITVADASDPAETELTITLNSTNGVIHLSQTTNLTFDSGADNSAAMTFRGSIADINDALNNMTFTPDQDFSGAAGFTLTADDADGLGSAASSSVDIKVTQVNDDPVLSPPANPADQATVNEGDGNTVTLTAAHLGLSDADIAAGDQSSTQIIIHIEALPTYGVLKLNGNRLVVGSTLSLYQLEHNQLVYEHDGSDTEDPDGDGNTAGSVGRSDSFSVHVDDGAGGITPSSGSTVIPLVINPVNDAPTVTANNSVYEGQTGKAISLSVADIDQATGVSHTIEITSLPVDGVLYNSGVAVVLGTASATLTTAELGNLTYSHDGNDDNFGYPPDDSFKIRITDDGGGTGSPMTTSEITIDLSILPNNDDPVLDHNQGDTPGNIVLDAPGTTDMAITHAMLQVTDVDTPIGNLTYTLTALPPTSEGTLRLTGVGELSVGSSFTQDDIDSGRLFYRFESGNAGEFNHTFSFTVKDGEVRAWPSVRDGGIYNPDDTTLTEMDFHIRVATTSMRGSDTGGGGTGSNTMPTLDGTATLHIDTVLEDGSYGITTGAGGILHVTDPDNTDSEIIYRLVTMPTNGSITLNGTALTRYDSFTQQDVVDNKVRFVHNGSEDFLSYFEVTVSDGTNSKLYDTDGTTVINEVRIEISAIPINDTPTATVKDSPYVGEGGTVSITTNHFSMADVDGSGERTADNDFDEYNANFQFQLVADVSHGKLEQDTTGLGNWVEFDANDWVDYSQLTSGRIHYVHDGSENFADSFQVKARDDHGAESPTITVDIEIAPFNDDPTHFSQLDMTLDEGGTDTIHGATGYTGSDGMGTPTAPGGGTFHLIYQDPDSTYVQRQYRITTAVHTGTLYLDGKALGVGGVFTQKDLDDHKVTYTHNGSEDHADFFQFDVRDGGGTDVPGRYDITILPKNDAPAITAPSNPIEMNDTTLAFTGGNTISVDDIDYTDVVADDMQVTLTVSQGTLTLGNIPVGLLFSVGNGTNDSTMTFHGTKADLNTALASLTFSDGGSDLNATVTLDITLNDLDNGGTKVGGTGPAQQDTHQITIWSSQDNDPNTINSPASIIGTEDTPLPFTGGNTISITDPDAFGTTDNTVNLKVNNGTITLGTTTGLTFTGGKENGNGEVEFTGTLANINTALASLSYTGNLDYNNNNAAPAAPDVLTISYDDHGNVGGDDESVSKTVDITVNAVNDQPTLAVPGTQTLNSGSSVVFSTGGGNAITFGDAKDLGEAGAGDNYTVTLKINNPGGTLNATDVAGVTETPSSDATYSYLTLTGTRDKVNEALQGLEFIPDNSNSDTTYTLNVHVNDNGGTGTPGPLTVNKNILIQVSGLNDDPAVAGPASVNAVEDVDFTFNGGNKITITDSDAFSTDLDVTLHVGHGTLTLATTAGLANLSGDGTGSVSFRGTLTEIDNALNGLVYHNSPDHWKGADTLRVTVNDRGNTGAGGGGDIVKDIGITVATANDAPLASGSVNVSAVNEDSSTHNGDLLSTLLGSKYDDTTRDSVGESDSSTALTQVAIVGNAATAAQGVWQYSTNGGASWTAIPTAGLSANAALVLNTDANARVRFLPTADWNGNPGALTVHLSDGTALVATGAGQNISGVLGGTNAWSTGTVDINTTINEANDAPKTSDNPDNAANATVNATAVNEDDANPGGDTVSSLFSAQFDDSVDDLGGSSADSLAGIAIVANTANPATQGRWQYNNGSGWNDIPATVSADNALILDTNDLLRFVGASDYNGTPPGLDVRIIDDSAGPVVSGASVDIDPGSGGSTQYSDNLNEVTLNVVVNPRNDAPTLGGATGFNGTVTESAAVNTGTPEQQLVFGAAVDDVDLATTAGLVDPVFGAGSVTVSVTGAAAYDQLSVSGALPAGVTISGTDNGVNGNNLVINFDADTTRAEVNSVLEAIRYSCSTDAPPASRSITITLSDGNNVDGGGDNAGGPTPLSVQLAATVNITETNDAPEGGNNTVSAVEDQPFTFSGADFNFSSPGNETDNLGGVRIDTLPGSGNLWLDVNNNGVNDGGAETINAGDTIAVADIGRLTYQAPANQNGSGYTSFTFSVQDDRGAYDLAPNTMTVDVGPRNDAPTFGGATAFNGTIVEQPAPAVGTNTQQLVTNADVQDIDLSTTAGLAADNFGDGTITVSITGSAAYDQLTVDLARLTGGMLPAGVTVTGGSNGADLVINLDPSTTRAQVNELLEAIDYQCTTSAPPASRTIDIVLSDGDNLDNTGGDTAGGPAPLTAQITATVNITPTNDAPVLTPANPSLDGIMALNEDQVNNAGYTVSDILGASVTDVDAGDPEGIALTGTTDGNGHWEYSIDGGAWTDVGSVANDNALLLKATDKIRFVPNAENPTAATLTYRAWDQSSGSAGNKVDTGAGGGDEAFSSATDVATLNVTEVNDAPYVNQTIPDQTAYYDNAFDFAFALPTFADVDTGEVLAYTAELADGSPLPAWLTFNPATRQFTGTPTTADAGTIEIRVIATDQPVQLPGGQMNTNTTFFITITETPPPVTGGPTPTAPGGGGGTVTPPVPGSTGGGSGGGPGFPGGPGVGGGPGGGGSSIQTPTVQRFSNEFDPFQGTSHDPLGNQPDFLATDFRHDDLTLVGEAEDRVFNELNSESYQIDKGIFKHTNPSEQLSYEAKLANGAPLPDWLKFDPETLTFTGTPPLGSTTLDIILIARDTRNNRATANFSIIINEDVAPNDRPQQGGEQHAAPEGTPQDSPPAGTEQEGGEAAAPDEVPPHDGQEAQGLGQDGDSAALYPEVEIVLGRAGLDVQLQGAGRMAYVNEGMALLNSLAQV